MLGRWRGLESLIGIFVEIYYVGSNTNNFILWPLPSPEGLGGLSWKCNKKWVEPRVLPLGRKKGLLRNRHHFQGSHEWQNNKEIGKTSSVRRYLKAECLWGYWCLQLLLPTAFGRVSDFGCLQLWLVGSKEAIEDHWAATAATSNFYFLYQRPWLLIEGFLASTQMAEATLHMTFA